MQSFLAGGSIFLLSIFFHHLAVSEKDFSNYYRPRYAFSHWYHLYSDILVKEHDDHSGGTDQG